MPHPHPDPQSLRELRRTLHRHAERSDREEQTGRLVADYLARHRPDRLLTGLGGHGLAAVFRGRADGPTVLLRADLDALPIPETLELEHGSLDPAVAHKCGHDGHMAMLAGVAPLLRADPPAAGSVVLLLQPAEETGQGARRVLDDPAFREVAPDWAFALHNLPGFPRGQVLLREGFFASASRGLVVELTGETSHASEPDKGRSPALAAAQLIQGLGAAPQHHTALHEAAQVTVVHARVGELAFGTSPGVATVAATLRTHSLPAMERLAARCLDLVHGTAGTFRLDVRTRWTEEFPPTVNDAAAAAAVRGAAGDVGLEVAAPEHPFPWSEDFGHFTGAFPGALAGLGAGREMPALHSPVYDFPDELLETGTALLERVARRVTAAGRPAGAAG